MRAAVLYVAFLDVPPAWLKSPREAEHDEAGLKQALDKCELSINTIPVRGWSSTSGRVCAQSDIQSTCRNPTTDNHILYRRDHDNFFLAQGVCMACGGTGG